MTTTPTTPTQWPPLRGHGAPELARDASDRLPPRTRITSVWTEETRDGNRLVYCEVYDTTRRWIGLVLGAALYIAALTSAAM